MKPQASTEKSFTQLAYQSSTSPYIATEPFIICSITWTSLPSCSPWMKLTLTLPAARSLTSFVNIALVRSITVPMASEPPKVSVGCAYTAGVASITALSAMALIQCLLIIFSLRDMPDLLVDRIRARASSARGEPP